MHLSQYFATAVAGEVKSEILVTVQDKDAVKIALLAQ